MMTNLNDILNTKLNIKVTGELKGLDMNIGKARLRKKTDWERIEGTNWLKCNNKKAWQRWMKYIKSLINGRNL